MNIFNLTIFIPSMFCAIALIPYLYMWNIPTLPVVDPNEVWGNADLNDTSIQPFTIKFDAAMIADLQQRLNATKYIEPLEGINFEYGFSGNYTKNWLQYWAFQYNFSQREAYFNSFKHYKTKIQGLNIHFMRATANATAGKEVIPMLLVHGWPGSVREFMDGVQYMTAVSSDRDFVFDLIMPSLPGFAWSDGAIRPGLGADKMAVVLRNLMHRLGFTKFYINGGDWGGIITKHLATLFPNEVTGYVANFPLLLSSKTLAQQLIYLYTPNISNSDITLNTLTFFVEWTGYLHLASTVPDTITVALTEPAPLIAYICEKFLGAPSTIDGGLTKDFPLDNLIDNLMCYYVNKAMPTAMRIYAETFNKRYYNLQLDAIQSPVPTVGVQARKEISYTDTASLQDKFPNLISNILVQNLSHFQCFEQPQYFSNLLTNAVGQIRLWRKNNNIS